MDPTFRLFDFKVTNEKAQFGAKRGEDSKEFIIQMFGIDERGKSYSLFVKNFQPFFYVKVGNDWGVPTKESFLSRIKRELRVAELTAKYRSWKKNYKIIPPVPKDGETQVSFIHRCLEDDFRSYYETSITDCKIIKRKKLYGFDKGKDHRFVLFKFKNVTALNKVKNLWYDIIPDPSSLFNRRYILKTLRFRGFDTELYEAKLPPLLRYFHIQKISPSGWVQLPRKKLIRIGKARTYCDFEFTIDQRHLVPLPDKETAVPAKICSFDIEASSSHGDFPMAIKTYKKLVGEIITYWNGHSVSHQLDEKQRDVFKRLILAAFKLDEVDGISHVYPKRERSKNHILEKIQKLIHAPLHDLADNNRYTRHNDGGSDREDDEDDEMLQAPFRFGSDPYIRKDGKTIIDYLNDTDCDKGKALEMIDQGMKVTLPALEGDKTTFIGSTFRYMGQAEPYLNHCVVLGTCDDIGDERTEIEEYDTEREVLLAWTELMQREKPDILVGYNTFGFDWKFMCDRAKENKCFMPKRGREHDDDGELWFTQLSKNRGQFCRDQKKTIKIASGTHELTFVKIDGVIQLDLYNYFRREVNLSSYKLNDVASHFIGDMVRSANVEGDHTVIKSRNLMGLQSGNFVCFETIGHSSDAYEDGKKFEVTSMNEETGVFTVRGAVQAEDGLKLRWGLGKDDISPQDIFEKTNGTSADRAIIAKYCIQDCNLLHHLVRKNDVLTGMSEIASICSIPIDFVVMRGQGIKLLSFIAKKCREKRTLMPVMDKPENDGSYEGAICLHPKKGLYRDPVAVVDFASLYPSSMISENISHDSKVWTKEYDKNGRLIEETGDPEYDGLDGYEYVDVEYDTYDWVSPDGKKKKAKVKVGTKVCRFAQFPDGRKAIMPAILQELLAARKATRARIGYKTIVTSDGQTLSGLLKECEDHYEITDVTLSDGKLNRSTTTVPKALVISVEPTYNSFMRNVFDKRQLGYKITANSLYGQCGAITSSFYEKDIAASTTATGRKLLIYAKTLIERVYKDKVCETKHGQVTATSDIVYGDTDSCFFTFALTDGDGERVVGKKALEITIELAIEAGKLATKFLKAPHDLEYEKTFLPFLLLSKKRYVGLLYERDPAKCERKSMGIVLKRRDNAPIVKDIYGGIIDILMSGEGVGAAVAFTQQFLRDIVDEKFPLEKLIISKSLRGFYKNPGGIAHKVLADRIAKRDPGNKPSIGSRIPFVFVQTKRKVRLQGDKIETPEFIRANELKPDYIHYITNQIMKPVQQVFALVLEEIPSFKRKRRSFKVKLQYLQQEHGKDVEVLDAKESKLRNAEVTKLIFESALRKAKNIKDGQKTINSFFT